MTIRSYEFGALFTRRVRGLHYEAGVEIKEVKGFLESRFYIDDSSYGGARLTRTLDRFVRELAEMDKQEEAEQQRPIPAPQGHMLYRFFGGQSTPRQLR